MVKEAQDKFELKRTTINNQIEFRILKNNKEIQFQSFRLGFHRKEYNKLESWAKKFKCPLPEDLQITLENEYQETLKKDSIGIKQEIPNEILEILKDSNLLKNLNKELDKKIKGEYNSRKTILLVANGRNVENPNELASYNLMVNSISGTGKDYIVSHTLEILPTNELIKRKRISKKVFTYWHNAKFEPTWTWDKKIFYNEDIPNSVLNEDVFKVMASSGNATSTIIINQMAVDIKIIGKPSMIITIAEAEPKQENLRRFPICDLDEGIDQTKAIMEIQSEFAERGMPLEYDERYKIALSYLKRIKVKIPYASKLIKAFPNPHLILRTNFNRFMDYIKSSCSLYQFQREQDEEGYYLATEEDFENAKIPLMKTVSNEFTIPLTNNQKKIIEVFKNLETRDYTTAELIIKMPFITRKSLDINLDKLVNLGFLKLDNRNVEYERTNPQGEIIKIKGREVSTYLLNKFIELKLPSYNEIITNTTIDTQITNTTNNTISTKEKQKQLDMVDKVDMVFGNQDAQINTHPANNIIFSELNQPFGGLCHNCKQHNPLWWQDQDKNLYCPECKQELSK